MVRYQGVPNWVIWLHLSQVVTKMLAEAAVLHEGSIREGSPSKFTHAVVGRFISWESMNWTSISCYTGFSIGQAAKWQLASSEQGHEDNQRECVHEGTSSLLYPDLGSGSPSCLLYSVYWVQFTRSRTEDNTRMCLSGGRNDWELVRRCLSQMPMQHLHEDSNSLCKPEGSILR